MSTTGYIHLRNNSDPPMYIHEIRGVVFTSWVSDKDKAFACMFPRDKRTEWLATMESLTGCKLIEVNPDGTDV